MKTWNLVAFGCLMLIALKTSGQYAGSKGIEYLIPDTVKTKILEAIKVNKPDEKHYLLWSMHNDTTSLMISSYSTSGLLFELIKNSNRFAILTDSLSIPIVISSDFRFSVLTHKIKNKGKENEIMDVTDFMISGYTIEFTGTYYNAKVIKYEYFTY